jgi:hypothetical protein
MVMRAGGLSGKEFGEKAVELREIGDIGHEHGRIYNEVEPTLPRPQHSAPFRQSR